MFNINIFCVLLSMALSCIQNGTLDIESLPIFTLTKQTGLSDLKGLFQPNNSMTLWMVTLVLVSFKMSNYLI